MKSGEIKKVCLIYCGGIKIPPSLDINNWLKNFLELQLLARVDICLVDFQNKNSWELAKEITVAIQDRYGQYDGFVITHGIDHLIYTSAMAAFMMQNISKPVIFTGSLPVLVHERVISKKIGERLSNEDYVDLNIKTSILNAIQIATMAVAKVAIVLGNQVVAASQAQITWQGYNPILVSKHNNYLAKIQFGIFLYKTYGKKNNTTARFNIKYNDNIQIIDSYPQKILNISKNINGLFIKAGQDQLVPPTLNLPKNIPVAAYSPKNEKSKDNLIAITDLTCEAALAKFIWALGQSENVDKVKKIMKANLAGEYKA